MFREEFARGAGVGSSNLGEPIITSVICCNSLLRAGLTHLLFGTRFVVAEPDSEVGVANASGANQTPDLLVVDASGSHQQTLTLVQGAKRQHPSARVALVADQFDFDLIVAGVKEGADSFCLTTRGPEVLRNILELTVLGERILPGAVLQSLVNQAQVLSNADQPLSTSTQKEADPRVHKLSPREALILHSLMGGDANKMIARKFDITEATVKVHVKAILRKIGAANRTQAAMWANENLRDAEGPVLRN